MKYIGCPRWDKGVSPPELLDFIDNHPPGDALDLGCGTGTNLLTLLKNNWQADGVDFAVFAVIKARRRIRQFLKSGKVYFGNVVHLDYIQKQYDLIVDIGCYHGLRAAEKELFQGNIRRLLKNSGSFLLYSFLKDSDYEMGIDENEIRSFQEFLTLESRKDGIDRNNIPSTWLNFQKASQ